MKARQSGFTLVEIIAAFALMAIALGLCLAVASRAYRQQAIADSTQRAALWAQSLLDDPDAEPLKIGVSEGDTPDRAFHWRREITAYVDPEGMVRDLRGQPALLQLRLQLQWRDGEGTRSLVIESLRRSPAMPSVGAAP